MDTITVTTVHRCSHGCALTQGKYGNYVLVASCPHRYPCIVAVYDSGADAATHERGTDTGDRDRDSQAKREGLK